MRLFHTAVKMSLVGVIASLIAAFFGLEFYLTAGILAILSIHLTKKDSIMISSRRVIDTLFGLALATLMFIAFGYNFLVFSIFVFIFAYVSFILKISEGIVPGLVLVTHLLLNNEFSGALLLNEVALLMIAVIVSLTFNLFYPQQTQKELDSHVLTVDQLVKDHLFMLGLLLKDPLYKDEYSKHFIVLDKKILETIDLVELVDKDLLFYNDHSYLAYFHMRKEQANYIRHMYEHALRINELSPYGLEISKFIIELSYDIGLYNKAHFQLKKLEDLLATYKKSELPKSRDEFELRATLYQIVHEIMSLLRVKINFHHEYPNFLNLIH
jgi:uncharacterized membrane protein YgaE (UPF0421/DUF939 family)